MLQAIRKAAQAGRQLPDDVRATTAIEFAVIAPQLVRKLVLVAPYGLWDDAHPLADPFVMRPNVLAQAKYADPARAESEPTAFDAAENGSASEYRMTNLAAASKLMWPIPDKGLKKRLHRVTAPTMIIWGEDDALISSVYAKEFADRIANSRIEIIKDCGHVPQVERLEIVMPLVAKFLDS